MEKTLYLIDGTALIYRAYYAFIRNPLINSKGMNTGAIFGVVNSFLHFIETKNPQHIVIAFDRKGPTFRHEMSEDYKANRPPMPEDMQPQLEPIRRFFDLVGIPELGKEGWEADDVLGSLAHEFAGKYQIVMVTGDKDYCQLVGPHIKLYDPMKDIELDEEAVKAKYGISPAQFIDYLALMGDSSDNIPGVKGIGPKGAQKLLEQFGDLDSIYQNIDQITGSTRTKLEQDKANAYLSQKLARIAWDMPLDFPDPSDIKFDPSSLLKATDILAEYELKNLQKRIETKYTAVELSFEENETLQAEIAFDDDPEQGPQEASFEAILVTKEKLDGLMSDLAKLKVISIDCETDSVDPCEANLVGISLAWDEKRAYYLPLAHQMSDNLPMDDTLTRLGQALKDKLLIGHNLKYDLLVLNRAGLKLDKQIFDTMLAAYILDPGKNRFGLDSVMQEEFGYQMQPITALIGKGKDQISFDMVDLHKASFYAAEDAWAALRLYSLYAKRLDQTGLIDIYEKIDLPLVPVLMRMEALGVFIDIKVLSEINKHLSHEINRLSEEIYEIAGYRFNLNSTQQLATLLFENMGLPARKKTKTGYSTDNTVLEELAEDYEIADKINQYRQLVKLDSTYVSALPKLINPLTGRLHSSFNQTVASTGRLSSSNPNLQNIPIRTELGRSIRKAFVAENDDYLIMSADYSQIELRLLALMSRDRVLLEAFANDVDIHRQTAARITGKPLEEVSSEERRQAKVINFGLLYGMGQKKLSRELGISSPEAKLMIEEYFAQFPGIRSFINDSVINARRMQYCETIFGRRLYLPQINGSHPGLRAEAERVAVNMPIQGSAADLIKLAMLDLDAKLRGRDDIRMILQVHDELIFEVKKAVQGEAEAMILEAMEGALPQRFQQLIRLKAELGSGKSWYEAH